MYECMYVAMYICMCVYARLYVHVKFEPVSRVSRNFVWTLGITSPPFIISCTHY